MSDIRERHQRRIRTPDGAPGWYCACDFEDWPCDAIQQADLADQLAGALRQLLPYVTPHMGDPRKQMAARRIQAALAAYEEARK